MREVPGCRLHLLRLLREMRAAVASVTAPARERLLGRVGPEQLLRRLVVHVHVGSALAVLL